MKMTLTLTDKDKNLLILLLAVALIAGSWALSQYFFADRVTKLDQETEQLKTEYMQKLEIASRKDKYVADTKKYTEYVEKKLPYYQKEVTQEAQIRFSKGLESRLGTKITSLSFVPQSELMTLKNIKNKKKQPSTVYMTSILFPVNCSTSRYSSVLSYIQNYPIKSRLATLTFTYNKKKGNVVSNFEIQQFNMK